jgi:hypothetical protein
MLSIDVLPDVICKPGFVYSGKMAKKESLLGLLKNQIGINFNH